MEEAVGKSDEVVVAVNDELAVVVRSNEVAV